MIADARERDESLDPARSFIIEAPAGSGKTGLLVQRFLKLLSVVERPESVVAMTFTRKAAADMKKRVVDALADAALAESPPVDEFKQKTRNLAAAALQQGNQRGWNLLLDPGRLQVVTIDSLSALLTRQMPVLSEFGGFGDVIEQASELYLTAAREMLVKLAEGSEDDKAVFRRMVLHFDNDVPMLEKQVLKMLGKRDQWEHLTSLKDAQLVQDCCRMLQDAETQLRLVFQRAGKVDFTEIARAARRALGNPEQPSDLLYSLDYRFQHLLVDEFQDTSRSQYDLVKALTEQWSLGDDHTLFLVGDPMQSIYRFREAEVSLFLRCWQEQRIGAVQLTPISLKTNFRSTHKILDWVQSQFAPMMPVDDKVAGAVQFRPSSSGRDAEGQSPTLIAHLNDDLGREEADEIVKIIQGNPERKIAILVRSRPQTKEILPALRKAGIAYEAIEIETLEDQQHVIDVLALTRALTSVADRVSWLACLRAPWCGLSLADLSALAENRRDRTILDLLSDPERIAKLSVDGRWRAVRVQEILNSAVAQVGRLPLRRLVEQTWRLLGGLAVIQQANQREDVETLFRLIEESEEGGIIRDFSLLNGRMEFLFARPSVAGAKVLVMTVYQAKGLEFDIVVLPRIGKVVHGLENELLLWTEDGAQLDIAAMPKAGEKNPDYTRVKDALAVRERNEDKRLFYVACTRAINELHLIGSTVVNKDGSVRTPRSGTFLRLIWDSPAVRAAFDRQLGRTVQHANANGLQPRRSPLFRLPVSWSAPGMAKSIQIPLPIRRAVASQRRVSYRWVSDTSRHAGTVIHELLKRIAAEGIGEWPEPRVAGLKALVGSELLRLGVPAEEKRLATEQVLRAVGNTIKSERGLWILSAHAEARSEWAIAGRVDGSLVSGTVDRAFLADDGNFWIIDFKNSDHLGAGRELFLANEKERYQPQLEQYAALVSKLVSAPISLGLYFPLLDQWLAWRFSESVGASG